jgi:D-alanyl-D-alanine carboxypeptidase
MDEAREGKPKLRLLRTLTTGIALSLALLPLLLRAGPAAAAPRSAAMAIDANTGAVLHNESGDALRYPASLTKMMTLYMTFELIELGRLSYDTKITMTKQAAAATPSKLGLKAGSQIAVIDAVKALVTKSANDIAMALAQHIGGTEANFAHLMTRRARQLGMKHTTFKNASGLPNRDQKTTARDMLILALHLQDDFPKHYKLFKTRSFTYRGKTYRNHNALLGRYRGTDGIKTGYTRASGFNLVTSVRRDGKHVVAAVFGGKTGRVRNAKMRALLNKTLAKASRKVTRKPMARVAAMPKPPPPVVRPAPRPVGARLADRTAPPSRAPVPTAAAARAATPAGSGISVARVRPVLIGPEMRSQTTGALNPRPRRAFATAGAASALPRFAPSTELLSPGPGTPPSTLQAQAAALDRGPARAAIVPAPRPLGAPAARKVAATPHGPFEIQVGAYGNAADAEQRMDTARKRASGLLDRYPAVAVPVKKGAGQIYRARFRGLESTAAASACQQLKSAQIDCFVVRTE